MEGKTLNSAFAFVFIVASFVGVHKVDGAVCGGLQGDVVFVLDASGSVGSANFAVMLSFVNSLIDDFDIGSDQVRVGAVRFESSVSIMWDLDAHTDLTSLTTAVSNIAYTGGGTNTGGAIYSMISLFSTATGDRSDITNVGIVITDGQSWSSSATAGAATAAKSNGITLFSIGIGTGVTELNEIASDPDSDHVFTVVNFNGLAAIESAFQSKACTSTTFNGTLTSAASVEDAADESGDTAAIAAGAAVGAVAVGGAVTAAVVYSKVAAAKTAVSKLASTANGPAQAQSSSNAQAQPEQQQPEPEQEGEDADGDNLPGLAYDAPANVQPMDTRWPARLPPLNV